MQKRTEKKHFTQSVSANWLCQDAVIVPTGAKIAYFDCDSYDNAIIC